MSKTLKKIWFRANFIYIFCDGRRWNTPQELFEFCQHFTFPSMQFWPKIFFSSLCVTSVWGRADAAAELGQRPSGCRGWPISLSGWPASRPRNLCFCGENRWGAQTCYRQSQVEYSKANGAWMMYKSVVLFTYTWACCIIHIRCSFQMCFLKLHCFNIISNYFLSSGFFQLMFQMGMQGKMETTATGRVQFHRTIHRRPIEK